MSSMPATPGNTLGRATVGYAVHLSPSTPVRIAIVAVLALGAWGCHEGTSIEPSTPTAQSTASASDPTASWSPRTRYAASLRASAPTQADAFIAAGDHLIGSPTPATLPLLEQIDVAAHGVAYAFELPPGRKVDVTIEGSFEGFIELFAQPLDADGGVRTARRLATTDQPTLTHDAFSPGRYVVRIQPRVETQGQPRVHLTSAPTFAFPVQGRKVASVQSFFGAPRDRGRREHHGIDIFAPTGTPVVAASDGYVRRVGHNARGGLVVWLEHAHHGHRTYYAHLSGATVQPGETITRGQVLGAVGNSGNARLGAPHLHFGLYTPRPQDPLPFVDDRERRAPPVQARAAKLLGQPRQLVRGARLYASPQRRPPVVQTIAEATLAWPVAARGDWVRVRLADGATGWVIPRSLRSPAEPPGPEFPRPTATPPVSVSETLL